MARKIYVGLVEILCGLVNFPITSKQIREFGIRLWDLGVLGPVNNKVSFHAVYLQFEPKYISKRSTGQKSRLKSVNLFTIS